MIKILLAVVAGVLNTLSFAPFNWWPLSLVSFAILFTIWLSSSPKQAILVGYFYGLAMFGVGISWMYISLNSYGGMPPAIAGFSIFLGIAVISIFPATCGWLQSLFADKHPTVRLMLLMPSIWIVVEWVRSWIFTGLPWLSTGYSYLDTSLSNFAPIGGVYLVGYIALLTIGALVSVIRKATLANGSFALLVLLSWLAGWQLNETAWTMAEGEPISVAIVQNNIPLSEKWDEAETNNTIASYLSKNDKLLDQDLVVWPEAAVPDYLDNLSNEFWRDIENHPADFIFGVLHRDNIADVKHSYNSVAAVTDQIMIYRKQHLVPFGEYFPLQWLFGPLLNWLEIPMSEFDAWVTPQQPLVAADSTFAVSICFEDAFPSETRSQIASAGILLNVSEDVWFGDSLAPHQRMQMARFRSRESERPMIRSSNTGLSSFINWKGGIDQFAPQFVEHIVKSEVQPRTGVTPYVAFGDSPIISFAGLMLLCGLLFGRKNQSRVFK